MMLKPRTTKISREEIADRLSLCLDIYKDRQKLREQMMLIQADKQLSEEYGIPEKSIFEYAKIGEAFFLNPKYTIDDLSLFGWKVLSYLACTRQPAEIRDMVLDLLIYEKLYPTTDSRVEPLIETGSAEVEQLLRAEVMEKAEPELRKKHRYITLLIKEQEGQELDEDEIGFVQEMARSRGEVTVNILPFKTRTSEEASAPFDVSEPETEPEAEPSESIPAVTTETAIPTNAAASAIPDFDVAKMPLPEIFDLLNYIHDHRHDFVPRSTVVELEHKIHAFEQDIARLTIENSELRNKSVIDVQLYRAAAAKLEEMKLAQEMYNDTTSNFVSLLKTLLPADEQSSGDA